MTSLALSMEATPTTNYISEADYWAYYYDQKPKHEWNDGQLERLYVSNFLTFQVQIWFSHLLSHFLHTNPIANLVGLEMGFRITLPIKKAIRRPDLAIVLNTNPVQLQPLDCSYAGIFDMCIEFLSESKPKEVYRDTVIKKAEYFAAGVAEYYILHHDINHCIFYTRDANKKDYVLIKPHNGIIASPLLPGFQFRLQDLKLLPHVNAMMNDSVYKDFVLPELQKDRLEAEVIRLKQLLAEKSEAKN